MAVPVREVNLCLVLGAALPDAQAEALVERQAEQLGVRYARIAWGWATRPPDRYGVAERDQLQAHLRDAGPAAVYLTIRIEEFDSPDDMR